MTISAIADITAELAAVNAAITAMLTNGQEHSLVGSHTFKGVPYSTLIRQRASLQTQLAAFNGADDTTLPDFSGSNS